MIPRSAANHPIKLIATSVKRARQDSNLQPSDSKSATLSVELRAQLVKPAWRTLPVNKYSDTGDSDKALARALGHGDRRLGRSEADTVGPSRR